MGVVGVMLMLVRLIVLMHFLSVFVLMMLVGKVVIIGSGASTHNLRALGRPDPRFVEWDQWLNDALAGTATERTDLLANWAGAPGGRLAHPREEHLLPLMVVAGAAGDDAVHTLFRDQILGHPFTNFTFGDVAA